MQIETTIQEFLLAGKQAGWSQGTSATYAWHLARFQGWLTAQQALTTEDLTRSRLRAWGASLREHWAPATIKSAVTAIRSFVRWLHEEEIIDENMVKALKVPRVPEQVQRTISAAEVQRLLVTCETPIERGLTLADATTTALRNAALVALLYDSLIRASELCTLQVHDINLDAGQLIIRAGKGGKDRIAVFGPQTTNILRTWFTVRPVGENVHTAFVSIGGNTPGQPLTPRGLRIILKNLGDRAGVPNVSPHTFRRGGTAQLTLDGIPTRVVQLLGGWSKIGMVELYTRWLTLQSDEVQEIYNGHSPVAAATRTANGEG